MAAEDDDKTAPDPWQNAELIGHENAEGEFLDSFQAGRLAHAWLISGPPGVGKATLAYRLARFMLARGDDGADDNLFGEAAGAEGLAIPEDDPVFKQIANESCGDLRTLRIARDESGKKARREIVVDEVRALQGFFGQTSMAGGWRIAIVDTADEMNRNAANALLKILEEPPANALIFLVSNTPGRLLPTIRSRCRQLRLTPLTEQEMAAALDRLAPGAEPEERQRAMALAEGCPGRALSILADGGLSLWRDLAAVLDSLPRLDVAAAYELADRIAKREGGFSLFADFLDGWLTAHIRDQAALQASRHTIDLWLDARDEALYLCARAQAVNLDPTHTIVDIFTRLQKAARGAVAA